MKWALIIAITWLAISVVAALLIARALRLADQRRPRPPRGARDNFVIDPDGPFRPAPGRPPAARKPAGRDGAPPAGSSPGIRKNGTR